MERLRKTNGCNLFFQIPLLAVFFFLLHFPAIAIAQGDELDETATTGKVPDNQSSPEFLMEQMTVTASKREAKIQDLPYSIKSFPATLLEDANLRDFNEVVAFIPGASEEASLTIGLRQYQIRGVAQGPGDPTVGYYIDDSAFFIYGVPFAPMGRSFDLERIEALRGPQSTLYGNGSMGGTVRFIPKEPNLSNMETHLKAGYLTTEDGEPSYYFDGAFNAPIVKDKLGVRLVGSFEKVGGYQETWTGLEDVNDADVTNLRGSLLWEPTDEFTFKFLYTRNEANQDGTILVESLDPPINSAQPGDFIESEYDLYAGTLIYDFGFATLNSTTTIIDFIRPIKQSYIVPWLPPDTLLIWENYQDAKALNNETRLVSQGDSPFQWLIGMFYSDTEVDGKASLETDGGIEILPPSAGLQESDSLSFFSEVSWSLFGGKLIPLVGLRYFQDDRKGTNTDFPIQPEPTTFESLNPRFSLSFQPTIYSHYYLNIAKGFRSGIFNNPIIGAEHIAVGLPWREALDSDEIWSYEIGTKQVFQNGQLLMDVALYYQDWQNVHQNLTYMGWASSYQVGDAEIYGIDFGMIYNPAAIYGLTLTANGNWNSAEFSKIYPGILAVLTYPPQNRLPFVPEYSATLSIDYAREITNGWMGQIFAGYSCIDAQYGEFDTGSKGDSRNLLRARIGVEKNHLGIHLIGNNLLGEDGGIWAQNPFGGITAFSQDHPRQIGIEIQYSF